MAKPTPSNRQAGEDWLLACADRPTDVRLAWAADELGRFRTGEHWRAAEVPLLRSLDAMQRIGSKRCGPVLADTALEAAWWLLPPVLGDDLDDIRGITIRPAGWVLACPPVVYPVHGRVWVEAPDGSGRLTDPVLLGAALGPGGHRLPAEVTR